MGRKVDHARGKVLGGSSSINGMIYQRGNPLDYEGWAEPEGMESWDFAHTVYLILKIRKTFGAAPHDQFRGHQGPIKLKRGPATNPLFKSFLTQVLKRVITRQRTSMVLDKKDSVHSIVKSIMVDVCLHQEHT